MNRVVGIVSVLVGVVLMGTYALQNHVSAQPANGAAELNARIEERRKRLNTKLAPADSARIKERCVAAQAKADVVFKKTNQNHQTYKTAYDSFIENLQKTQQQLTVAGTDTSQLQAKTTTLLQQYQTYQATINALNLSLSDLKSVNCAAEPNGFIASLSDARTQQKTAQTTRKEMTKYVKETIVPELKTLKPVQGANQ